MRHNAKGRQLSRTSSHRRALLNNMATSLFTHDGITTTVAKAKELRPFAEKLITMARRGDLHSMRLVGQRIKDRELPRPAVQGDRAPVRGPPGRLYPDPQAGSPSGRRRRHGQDRVAARVTVDLRSGQDEKGTPSRVPFFLAQRDDPGRPRAREWPPSPSLTASAARRGLPSGCDYS